MSTPANGPLLEALWRSLSHFAREVSGVPHPIDLGFERNCIAVDDAKIAGTDCDDAARAGYLRQEGAASNQSSDRDHKK